MGLEERDASELETGQRVSISGSEGQGRPNAFGLVFGCWLDQEFNEPFAASGRIEANGGQFVLGVGGFAGFGDLAGEVRRPFGSDEFFGNGTAFSTADRCGERTQSMSLVRTPKVSSP